ncbi:MAG: glycosyltransferase family 9 protein [Nitrospinae bacterium]|nr:glycosyltransferase family 9 protein [Nitrospinota bacterium]
MKIALAQLIKSAVQYTLDLLVSPKMTVILGEPFFYLMGLHRKRGKIDMSQVKHALVVRLDGIGDIALTTPFLRQLRHNLTDAWITLIVKPDVYNLVELCPYVNEVLTYDFNTQGCLWQLRRHCRALRLAWRHLWKHRFDIAILPRWDVDHYHGTFIVYFSGASWRVGYSENVIERKKKLNSGYDYLFTHVIDDKTVKHEVEHNMDLIRFLGGDVQNDRLEVWLGEEDKAFADSMLRRCGVKAGELVIGFGASGGNSSLKQWPASNFIELGRRLMIKYNSRILIVGSSGEESLGSEIEQELGSSVINAVGNITLRQMAALLKRCRLYVGNDSGPMHVASAVGIPVVAIFGSSCHHRFGPWGDRQTILWQALPCSPCFQSQHLDRCNSCIFDHPRCIFDITIEQVQRAVEDIFHHNATNGFMNGSSKLNGERCALSM